MNERRWIVVVVVVSQVKEHESSSLCARLQGSGLENNNTTVVVVLLVVSALWWWWWWWRLLSLQTCVSGRRRKVKDPRTALFSDDLQPLTDICEEWLLLLRREASRFLFASYFLLLLFVRLDVFWSGLAQSCFTGEIKVERDIVSTNCIAQGMRWCSHRRLQV
jgi:hypothetical protein